jgi:hypothetical protein
MKLERVEAPKDEYRTDEWKKWLRKADIFTTTTNRDLNLSSDHYATDGMRGTLLIDRTNNKAIHVDTISCGWRVII